jgi:hypothetical protein
VRERERAKASKAKTTGRNNKGDLEEEQNYSDSLTGYD